MDIAAKTQPMDSPQQVILIAVDPRIDSDTQTGRTIIRGMDELQLEMIVDRLKHEFNVDVTVGKPQVAYKETLTQMAEGVGRFVGHIGGHGHYAHGCSPASVASTSIRSKCTRDKLGVAYGYQQGTA